MDRIGRNMSDQTRVGINGFGRMGRLALRAGWDRPDLEFVHVNEPACPAETVGAPADVRLGPRPLGPRSVTGEGDELSIDGRR